MKTMLPKRRRLADESGSAITEMAIFAPLVVMLMLYSIYFTDVLQVRLKSLEISRFVAWEKTVFRDSGAIVADAEERFQNLRSYDREPGQPNYLLGVRDVDITITLEDDLPVNMAGDSPPFRFADQVNSVLGFMDNAQTFVAELANLPTAGKARSEVTIAASNAIVPDAVLQNIQIQADELQTPFTFTTEHFIIYDTWKAWPNHNNQAGFTNSQEDVMNTYEVAEQLVAAQIDGLAFAESLLTKIPGVHYLYDAIGYVDGYLADWGLPPLLDKRHSYHEHPGPVTMRPASNDVENFSPSHGRDDATRLGHLFGAERFNDTTPLPYVDRSRYSIPFRPNTGHWEDGGGAIRIEGLNVGSPGDGGYAVREMPDKLQENAYSRTWDCRGHYYEGMITYDNPPGDRDNYDGCGDAVDGFLSNLEDLLDGLLDFGGNSQTPPLN